MRTVLKKTINVVSEWPLLWHFYLWSYSNLNQDPKTYSGERYRAILALLFRSNCQRSRSQWPWDEKQFPINNWKTFYILHYFSPTTTQWGRPAFFGYNSAISWPWQSDQGDGTSAGAQLVQDSFPEILKNICTISKTQSFEGHTMAHYWQICLEHFV